jgi:hypothetical protein
MMRFTTIAAVASVAILTARDAASSLPRTSSAVCTQKAQHGFLDVLQSATAVPQRATAA